MHATIPTVGVVVTAFNQGRYVSDAIESVLAQTHAPASIVLVDDGSTDAGSRAVLDEWSRHPDITLVRRANGGVGAARNSGIAALRTEFVAVLDGDDAFEPEFIERTLSEFADPSVVGASSWLRMHGVATAIARPLGGTAADFLSRNAAPAAALFHREDWLRAGGYAEAMREGFEDWDFFLSLLTLGGRIAVVPEPLLRYRTAPASANIRSMDRRSELYGRIIDRHRALFKTHLRTALIALDADRGRWVTAWEHAVDAEPDIELADASFGDGGMAAVVRVETRRHS